MREESNNDLILKTGEGGFGERMYFAPSFSLLTITDPDHSEMIRITNDGFYVRGVRVKQNKGEARKVYKAFKRLLKVGHV